MKPMLSSRLPRDEWVRLANSMRRCYECGHAIAYGQKCPWCSGQVQMYEPWERKLIPKIFLDPTKVEHPIDPETFGAYPDNWLYNRAWKFSQIGNVKLIEYVSVKIEHKSIYQNYRDASKARELKENRLVPCGLPGCPNQMKAGKTTCSTLCNIKLKRGAFVPGKGFVTISDEEAQVKLEQLLAKRAIYQAKRKAIRLSNRNESIRSS